LSFLSAQILPCLSQDGTVRTYIAFAHWVLSLPQITAKVAYVSCRPWQTVSLQSAWEGDAGGFLLWLVTDCCLWDFSV